mmetsp:Transcript_20677/g.33679  ORF Transcript_20677/g.33679 Transcript_20677/m.33679 type:complete len:769 (+) Transcript_20677:189-2495(+)
MQFANFADSKTKTKSKRKPQIGAMLAPTWSPRAFIAVLLAVLTLSIGQVRGRVFPGRLSDKKRLIASAQGLAVKDEYIGIAKGLSNRKCEELKRSVDKMKMEVEGAFARDGLMSLAQSSTIGNLCVIKFASDANNKFDRSTRGYTSGYSDGIDSGLHMAVASLKDMDSVEPNKFVQIAQSPIWGLNRIDQYELPLSKRAPFSISHTGKGINIYVLDTGVNLGHDQFKLNGESRAQQGGDFINERVGVDLNGHGSHCAGSAAGKTLGVARDATVIAVKVLGADGSGTIAGVVSGIEWAMKHANGKSHVISMSLAGGKSLALNNAVKAASMAGMIVVVAGGNDAKDACDYSPASAGGDGELGDVITVGSTMSTDRISYFSNYGKCVDIFAPGSHIKSAWKGSRSAMNIISGTSMSTPHVAGVAAALLEKHGGKKRLAQAELFGSAVRGEISGLSTDTPNVFLQTPRYTGAPTPPTAPPTPAPTLGVKKICMHKTCTEYAVSKFGPDLPDQVLQLPLVVAENDGLLCDRTPEDFTGKAVLVTRGNCFFFDKVRNAQKQGAKFVLIHLTSKFQDIVPPTYYFDKRLDIPSVLIPLSTARKFRALEGKQITIGYVPPSQKNMLTFRPTARPTRSPIVPTSRPTRSCAAIRSSKQCNGDDRCFWGRLGRRGRRKCIDRTTTSRPTPQPTAFIPNACHVTTLQTAISICAKTGRKLCTRNQLRNLAPDNKCGFDGAFVFTASRCSRRRTAVFKKVGGKTKCVSANTRTKYAVKCC